eukprot:tig00021312_g20067.t1
MASDAAAHAGTTVLFSVRSGAAAAGDVPAPGHGEAPAASSLDPETGGAGAGTSAPPETVELGDHGEFRLVSEEGPLPSEVVARLGRRLPKLRGGLARLGLKPACSFPLVLHISPPGARPPLNPPKGGAAAAYARAYSSGFDFDRDYELIDRAVVSQFLLGTSAPPPQWAWLVDGTLGCLHLESMAKAEQFHMNTAALNALRESASASRGAGAADAGGGGLGGAPAAGQRAATDAEKGKSGGKDDAPESKGPGGAAPNSLLSILSGPTARNTGCYRLLATSFVSFLAAAHPKTFSGELLRHARQQIGPSEALEHDREPVLWEESGALLPGRSAFRVQHLERAWRGWVEGRVDGRRRGLLWVFTNAFRLMGAYPARIALSILGLVCHLAMQALLILSFERVIEAAEKGDEAELRKYVVLLASFGAASIVGTHAFSYIQSFVIAKTLEDLQVELMRHLLSMPDSYLRDADEGSLLSYFASDVWALEPTLASVFRMIQAVATFSLQVALMVSLDYRIAPVVIVIQLAIVLSQRTHNTAVARASSDKQKAMTGVLSVVKEVVMGATVIRDYGLSEKTLGQFRASLAVTTDALFRLRMHSMIFVMAIICFNQFLQGATLSVMGYLALRGAISKGQLAAIYFNVTTLGSASATIVTMLPEVTKGSGPLQRICAFLLIPEDEEILAEASAEQSKSTGSKSATKKATASVPESDPEAPVGTTSIVDLDDEGADHVAPQTAKAALRVRGPKRKGRGEHVAEGGGAGPMSEGRAVEPISCAHVSFAYRSFDTRMVLNSVSLTIQPRTSVCIVGGSGCGKSTLLGILMRNYRPTRGTITYGGVKLHKIPRAVWKHHVRVVQQSAFIFSDTARQNIAIGKPGATDDEVVAAATLAQIHDVISELPEGYNTAINMKSLSGGQKQRICIARALIGEPKILVLDECTSALDAESERRINAMLEEASRRMTVIQVTHRLAAAEKCDEIIVLDKGHVVERGPFQELAKAGGAFSHLLNQAGEAGAPLGPARTPAEIAALLRRFEGFRAGPDAALLALAAAATVEEYRKGDTLCGQDTPATHLNLVLSGALAKERTGLEGKPHPLGALKQGELTDASNVLLAPASARLAGEGGPAGRAPWNHFALLAASDARVLRLPLPAVNRFLRSLGAAELAEAFPHLEEGRRAVYNWKRGRLQLGQQRAFLAAVRLNVDAGADANAGGDGSARDEGTTAEAAAPETTRGDPAQPAEAAEPIASRHVDGASNSPAGTGLGEGDPQAPPASAALVRPAAPAAAVQASASIDIDAGPEQQQQQQQQQQKQPRSPAGLPVAVHGGVDERGPRRAPASLPPLVGHVQRPPAPPEPPASLIAPAAAPAALLHPSEN